MLKNGFVIIINEHLSQSFASMLADAVHNKTSEPVL